MIGCGVEFFVLTESEGFFFFCSLVGGRRNKENLKFWIFFIFYLCVCVCVCVCGCIGFSDKFL